MNSIVLVTIAVSTCFIFSAQADQEKKANTTVRFCYECTSARDPGCADGYEGSEKFPHEGKLKFNYSRNCADADLLPFYEAGRDPVPVAVGCRKILQEVDGKTRVVRQCAYNRPDGSDEVTGLKRTGNQGVRLFYYQCPRDYCNGNSRPVFGFITFLIPFIAVILARW